MTRRRRPRRGWRPTASQELLLKAVTLPGPRGFDAWRRFRAEVEVEQADPAAARLFPLAFSRLGDHGLSGPDRRALSLAYRQTWMSNQQLIHRGGELLEALHAAGVETLLLKGAALLVLDYSSVGERPMADLDVLVRPEQVEAAVEVLAGLGREPVGATSPSRLAFLHADTFPDPAGASFELHWQTIVHREPEDDLWERSVPVRFGRVATRSLCATDRLLHVCVHGLLPSEPRAIRWVPDALAIMDRHDIEWPRLLDQSRRREVTVPMAAALAYLNETLEASVPADVIADLRRGSSRLERAGYRAAVGRWDLLGVLRWYWFLCRRVTPNRWRAAVSFPQYLRLHFGYDSVGDFARYALDRLARGPRSVRPARHLRP